MYTPFSELSTFNKAATIALYLTIAIIVIIVVALYLLKKNNKDTKAFGNISFGLIIGYSIGLIAILLFLKFDEYKSLGYIDKTTFIPVLILLCGIIALTLIALIISIFARQHLKKFSIIATIFISAGLLALIIITLIKQYKEIGSLGTSNEAALYIFTALIVAAITLLAVFFGKKSTNNNTKAIVYAAACIATSFALSYIRFFELPSGGSITFASLVPLMLYSKIFGIRKGVLAGVIYGFLQFIQAPWFYHPIQFLLDYPIAFGAIGLTGIFSDKNIFGKKLIIQFAFGAVIAVTLRYLSHVVSGIYVFGSGDPENYGAVAWSFLYNSFTYIDIVIALVAGCALLSSKHFVKAMNNAVI